MTYTVDTRTFKSFSDAIDSASAIGCDVIETATGKRRWTPANLISSKVKRLYSERLAARKAYDRMNAGT